MNIIVRKYDHFNSAMGKHITSKRHYEQEMAKGGYIPYDKACEIADKAKNKKINYELSPKAREIINSARSSADKRGNIKVSDRLIEGMKSVGVRLDINRDVLPKHYHPEGGFNAT